MKRIVFFALWLLSAHAMAAAITVRDDNGDTLVLQKPAQRIVTLAPHATELVFAAGGGERIVGTVGYSNYPPAAASIPVIGDHRQIDMERLLALKPDLLVVWLHGNSMRQLEALRKLGIPLFYTEPRKLDAIPEAVAKLGKLAGTESQAQQSAAELRQTLANLAAKYRNRPTVRVFYQVWNRPLYTLNGEHIVSDAIRLCGGENVFAGLSVTAPMVTIESVLLENPEVVITGESRKQKTNGLEMWKTYPALLAARRGNLFSIDADLLNRAGPRFIAGTAALCEKLELARSHRKDIP